MRRNKATTPSARIKRTHQLQESVGGLRGGINIALAGCGGSGSVMVSRLVQIDLALRAKNKGRLHVTVFDPDIVTESNVGRQMYYPPEVGLHKSVALVDRVNKGFGLEWEASIEPFLCQMAESELGMGYSAWDFLITCVDTTKARRDIDAACQESVYGMAPKYWLDLGNDQTTGQVVLGQFERGILGSPAGQQRLPTVVDLFPALYAEGFVEDNLPSCSLAEALDKQDLFINSEVAGKAAHLLWRLLSRGEVDCQGYWVNLDAGTTLPMPIRDRTLPKSDSAKSKRMSMKQVTQFSGRDTGEIDFQPDPAALAR